MRHRLDLSRRADGLIRGHTALRVDQVRGENRVDQGRLPQTGLTCIPISYARTPTFLFPAVHTNNHHIELEATLQQLFLNLLRDAVETDMALREDRGRLSRRLCRHGSKQSKQELRGPGRMGAYEI